MDTTELPRYQCFKQVQAAKIASIAYDADAAKVDNRDTDGSAMLFFVDPDAFVRVSSAWLRNHQPQIGGYYVVYKDNYQSYSPEQAFEEGYARL